MKRSHAFHQALTILCAAQIALFSCSVQAGEVEITPDGAMTIQQAVDKARAGDVVMVQPGEYAERIVVRNSGREGQPIVIQASRRRSARTLGFDVRGDHVTVRGFEITSKATGLEGCGVVIYGDHATVEDCYIHDMMEKGIIGHWRKPWAADARIAGNRIYRCNAGIAATGDRWLVENNEIERLMQNTPKMDCDYMRVFGQGVVVRGNRFFGTKREEIGSAHVDGFQTYDNNDEYLNDALFERNVVMDCHQGFMANGKKGGMHDIVFRGNVFARCWSWGLDMHFIKDVTIEDNLFADMQQHCIGFRPGSTGTIRNNIFYRAGSMFFADEGAEFSGGGNINYQSSASTRPLPGDRQMNPRLGGDYRLTADSPTEAGPQWYREGEADLDK